MTYNRLLTSLCLLVVSVLSINFQAHGAPVPGKVAPDFMAYTTQGVTITLSELQGKPVVLEWTNHDCPYVKKHYSSGNMQRLQRKLTQEGVIWISIISSAPGLQGHVTTLEADALTARRGSYTSHVILDPDGTIGRAYHAKTTPQMVLIGAEGLVQYMGAIDDKPSARLESLEGAQNYVLAAWASVKAGTQVEMPTTKPYGCSVKYQG
ncbi:MAG: redoxin domain-containing protein [Kordiimonadaceae bacterium]|nr:redoxin domain-containing protein [Kordiimonadaceae bacterium]